MGSRNRLLIGTVLGILATGVALSVAPNARTQQQVAQLAEGAELVPIQPPADGPLDPARTDSMLAQAASMRPLSSLLVWHRGELVIEEYYSGMRADRAVNLKSVSKTLLSPLVGIALRDSLFASIDQPLRELLPEYYARLDGSPADDPRKDDIRLSHLLDMSSGLQTTSFGNYGSWVASPDWGWDQLRRPIECRPGRCFEYTTGGTHLVGIALARAAGKTLRQYARESLFGPMGIGGMIVREGVDVRPSRFGGTGVDSIGPFQPDDYPHRLEAGTVSRPAGQLSRRKQHGAAAEGSSVRWGAVSAGWCARGTAARSP